MPKSKIELFKCLDPWFEEWFPEEAKLIYRYFFLLIEAPVYVETLKALGLDPRDLIGSKVLSDYEIECEFECSWVAFREQFSLTIEELAQIKFRCWPGVLLTDCEDGYTVSFLTRLKDNFYSYEAFGLAYLPILKFESIAFAEVNLNDVLGDKDSCRICKCDFEAEERILKLNCGHIFHLDCIRFFETAAILSVLSSAVSYFRVNQVKINLSPFEKLIFSN